MAKLFIKPAADGLNHHNYQPLTVATLDFGEPLVSRCIETVDSDKWNKIAGSAELQLAPQVFPPFGDLYVRSAAFFCPEHQIFSASEAFHNNQTTYKGRAFKLPTFRPYYALNDILNTASYSVLTLSLNNSTTGLNPNTDFPSEDQYDFITVGSYGSGVNGVQFNFWKLTQKGYRYYRLFKTLGYDFVTPPFLFYDTLPTQFANRKEYILSYCNYKRSALPFIAYLKVYVDYFMPGQFFNGSPLTLFLQSIHDNVDCTISGNNYYYASTGTLVEDRFISIFNLVKTPVLQNMYTSAWNAPNSPLGTTPSDYCLAANQSIISPYMPKTSEDQTVYNSPDGVYTSNSSNTDVKFVTSFGLRIQKAFEQFVIRNNLAGTRPVQRTLARFGRKPSDATSHFVSKLYEGSERIPFHPVLSNSAIVQSGTTKVGEGIGDIAGFSKSGFNFEFGYEASDYGFIIIMHWLQIKPIMLHGQDPSTMRLNPFDWYTPEYDGQALRAIPMCEISIQKDKRTQSEVTADLKHDEEIYGFTNIYDDYREMRDVVAGDFLNGSTKNFLFARDYTRFRSVSYMTMKPQSNDIQLISGGGFTQPFQMSDMDGDRFWMGIRFDIDADRPVKSKSDALMLNGSGSVEISQNGTSQS